MNDAKGRNNQSDSGLLSFKMDEPLQVTAVVVSLLAISLYDNVIALRPWSWLARGGPNTGIIMGFTAVHLVVFCAMALLLFSWMKRRTASSTLTLAGLILVLFIKYPIMQDGPLAFFIGQGHSPWRLIPVGWDSLEVYSYFAIEIGLALWINYLVYRLAQRHGIMAALVVSLGLWGFCLAPMLPGASLPQTVVLSLTVFSLGALAWRPSSVALKAFVGLTAAYFLVGVISGGLGNPVFTGFGLKRVTLVPFLVFSTGVVGAALAAVLARRQSKAAEQVAAT